jgi:tRNA threonylcarbamoyladenosine biosynthesis protein TsaB
MTSASKSIESKFAPTLLAMDTSTNALAVAVVRDGKAIGAKTSEAERNHSVRIVSDIQELLRECGVASDGLDGIAVGQGPGSYTGVRIAVTVAKTLAWTWNKPLIGVSSLEALAYGAWTALRGDAPAGAKVWIVPLMNARRGQAYTALFAAGADGGWERLDSDGIRLFADWSDSVALRASGVSAVWFVGETGPFEAEWAARWNGHAAPSRLEAHTMEADAVGLLGERRIRQGETDETHRFAPNYTQLTEAEAKLQTASRRD